MRAPNADSSPETAHIVLVGQMGAGKTTVGQLVAGALGRPFRDNDVVLYERTGKTAATYGRHEGMSELHDVERAVLQELLDEQEPAVLAAPASVLLDSRCRAALRARAFVVWLHVSPPVLAARASTGGHRPLPDEDRHALFEGLVAERDALYAAAADLVIDANDLPPERAAERVVQAVRFPGTK
jgi:shikimate kinase